MKAPKINLPCLKGRIGDWTYFSTIIKVKDIVENNRIITVAESPELYSDAASELLQRGLDNKRITTIKTYILENKERFFSSLLVSIHKGSPKWTDFDFERRFRDENEILNDSDISFIENKIGVLTLNGDEELFALDGQHRLLGIREAYKNKPDLGNEELSLILVLYNPKHKERTRRLFTVLNKYSVGLSPLEKILLDEDDAAAILTRRLVDENKFFRKKNAISRTAKSVHLEAHNTKDFTTYVCLYEINKILIHQPVSKKQNPIRPTVSELESHYMRITDFWENFFERFQHVQSFIDGDMTNIPESFLRNKRTGGSLLLRPEGQKLISEVYMYYMSSNNTNEFWAKIIHVDFALVSDNWKYVFWNKKMLKTNKALKKSILKFLLGNKDEEKNVVAGLENVYSEIGSSVIVPKLRPII